MLAVVDEDRASARGVTAKLFIKLLASLRAIWRAYWAAVTATPPDDEYNGAGWDGR